MLWTTLLALIFTLLQSYECKTALFRLSDGTYGSAFYLSTGYSDFHVIVGIISLAVCLVRLLKWQLAQQHKFEPKCSA